MQYNIPAIGGTSWTNLAPTAPTRVDVYAEVTGLTVLSMNGGQHDIAVENDSAAKALTDFESYADARRAAGWDRVIVATVCDSTTYTAPQETVRAELNAALRISDHFDAVVDLAVVPQLMDASNATYFSDGTHFTEAGAIAAAAAYEPVLMDIVAGNLD